MKLKQLYKEVDLGHAYDDKNKKDLFGTAEIVKGKTKKIKGVLHHLLRFDGHTEKWWPADRIEIVELSMNEVDIVKPKKNKKTPPDAMIQVPDMGTMKHEQLQKNLVRKLQDMIKKSKHGEYYLLKDQQLNMLKVMWETLKAHQGDK
jgi:hypothetical protein